MTSPRNAAGCALLLMAQVAAADPQARPFRDQSSSTIDYSIKDNQPAVEIRNVAYQVSGDSIPGLPRDQRLVLRKTTHSSQVLGDIGQEATVLLEAWRLGSPLSRKPLYAITLDGVDVTITGNALLVFARGLEEVSWWSVYKLGDGRHLFDTYAPLVEFSTTRDIQTPRFAGFEAPPDDAADTRLKEPHVVGVLTYASEERVIREVLLTCDDPKRARLLRSYWDQTRAVSFADGKIKASFTANDPGKAPAPVEVIIPIVKDDLDLAHAKLPPGLRAVAWKR